MCDTETTIAAKITQIQDTDLPQVRAAISKLIAGEIAEYWLDTGPSNQKVKRLSLPDLQAHEKYLNLELARLCRSIGPSGTVGVPCW